MFKLLFAFMSALGQQNAVPSLRFNELISNDKLSEAGGEMQLETIALCSHMFSFLIRPVALVYVQLPFLFKRATGFLKAVVLEWL